MAQVALPTGPVTLHASCVALRDDAAVIIIGASGRGKSSLALQMIGLGCSLVADDRTCIAREDGVLVARAPASLAGLIEARGIGILRAPTIPQARVTLVVDLDATEPDRLPPRRRIVYCECEIDLVKGPVTPHFASSLILHLAQGRQA
jgi:HPr kinase/phosphorylase